LNRKYDIPLDCVRLSGVVSGRVGVVYGGDYAAATSISGREEGFSWD
ncbi:hypothetical protein A2U01_0108233, partial [Trifolium medium]|nr:hypothetical protein [Trifolium medium]